MECVGGEMVIRILQGLLAVGFLMSGILKLISSAEQIRECSRSRQAIGQDSCTVSG
jgi:hypothetical protein